MTRSRAFIGAFAAGGLALMGSPLNAQVVNDISGQSQPTDNSAGQFFELVLGFATQYDGVSQLIPGQAFVGPIVGSGYYALGDSPCERAGGIAGCAVGQSTGDGKIQPALTGTVTIDPGAGTSCDGDETLAAEISLSAAIRTFSGGPGTFGEESWGDNDLTYTLAATTVDSATPDAGGCDYEIADAGFPPILTANGGANILGEDLPIGDDAGAGEIPWDAPGIPGVATWENSPNTGTLMTVTTGASYACNLSSGPCGADGSNHQNDGTRGTGVENTLWSVSTDAGGNIDQAQVLTINIASTGNSPSWDGALWQFTGTVQGAGPAANPDTANALQDGPTINIDVLANDSNVPNPNTLTISTPSANGAVVAVVGASPGDPAGQSIDYTPPAGFTGDDTFEYQIDDGAGTTDTAVVTVTVAADTVPVAPDGAGPDIDTTGVAPESQTSVIDVSTLAGYDPGNPPVIVTIDTDGALGTTTVNGTTLTYTPANNSFVGSDSVIYQVEDAQGDTDTGTITIDYVDSQPAIGDVQDATDVDTPVDIDVLAAITPGNGELGDHILTGDANSANGGTVAQNGTVFTYTPAAGFEGMDTFNVTLEDANGDQDTAVVTVNVTAAGANFGIPGGSSALSPLSLLLLLGVPLLRRRRRS